MNENKRILVVVDPTAPAEQCAVQRGAMLAEKKGVGLELLICYYDQYLGSQQYMKSPTMAESRQEVIHQLRLKLESMAKPLREKGIGVIVTAIWDEPLDEAIVRYVGVTKPAMVVKETHYHNKISRTIFTHTDWNLVRNCPVPLWLTKPVPWQENAPVLAAVDPLQEHDKPATMDGLILNNAEQLSRDLGCDMHVFHAYAPVTMLAADSLAPMPYPVDDLNKNVEQTHRKRLSGLLRPFPTAKDHMMSGYPSNLLPDLAQDLSAGVVVMGSMMRNRIKRAFIGSTAEKVLPLLPCDLLIVKPGWFTADIEEGRPEVSEGTRDDNESNAPEKLAEQIT